MIYSTSYYYIYILKYTSTEQLPPLRVYGKTNDVVVFLWNISLRANSCTSQ